MRIGLSIIAIKCAASVGNQFTED